MSSQKINLDTVLRHLPVKESQRFLFNRLDHESLLAARCVNKLWQSLVDPLVEFHVELSDKTKKYVQGFGCDRPVLTVSSTAFQGVYPKDGLSLNAHMLRITVNVLDGDESFQSFRQQNKKKKKDKDDIRKVGLSQFNFRRLVQDFYFVDKLHIASLAVKSFWNPKVLSRLNLPNVKELIVTFFDGGFHQLIPFMRNSFPQLKIVNIANVAEVRKERSVLYSWIYGFVANHFKTLTDVTLIFPEGLTEDDEDIDLVGFTRNSNRPHIRDHKMPQVLYEKAKSNLQKMCLETFMLDMSTFEGLIGRYDMGLTILNSQTQLKELHLDNLHIKDMGVWRKMGTILEKCSGTLVSISFGGCFCGPSSAPGTHSFPCSWVKNCKKLKELQMTVCGLLIQSVEDLPKNSLRLLNLGHMLNLEQIEYIAVHLTSLETWVLPQRGSLVNHTIPKISRYLFEAILHLPKLTKLNLSCESSEKEKILEWVKTQDGIHRCGAICLIDEERNGNLNFHIKREIFFREHSNLKKFMDENRKNHVSGEDINPEDFMDRFIRNLVDGRHLHFRDIDIDLIEEDDEDEDMLQFYRIIDLFH